MVKVETEAPALWRKPPETANPSTLDKRASPRLYRPVWRVKVLKEFWPVGADDGFVPLDVTDRNPWTDARGGLDPVPSASVCGGRHRDRGLDYLN